MDAVQLRLILVPFQLAVNAASPFHGTSATEAQPLDGRARVTGIYAAVPLSVVTVALAGSYRYYTPYFQFITTGNAAQLGDE